MRQEIDWQPAAVAPVKYPLLVWNPRWLQGQGMIAIGVRTGDGHWQVKGFLYPEDEDESPEWWAYPIGPDPRNVPKPA